MEISYCYLLYVEEGIWLNIDGFYMGIGGDDFWSLLVLVEF